MTTWSDLPQEVKQTILGYVVENLAIRFHPRHAGTRSSRAKVEQLDEANTSNGVIDSMLLVSKHFVTYNELEPVLLSGAVIQLEDKRSLKKLETRFTKEGLANIQELAIDLNTKSHAIRRQRSSAMPPETTLRETMTSLRKLTVQLGHAIHRLDFASDEIALLATGEHLDTRTDTGRQQSRQLVEDLFYRNWYEIASPLHKLLCEGTEHLRCERVVKWTLDRYPWGTAPEQLVSLYCVQKTYTTTLTLTNFRRLSFQQTTGAYRWR